MVYRRLVEVFFDGWFVLVREVLGVFVRFLMGCEPILVREWMYRG